VFLEPAFKVVRAAFIIAAVTQGLKDIYVEHKNSLAFRQAVSVVWGALERAVIHFYHSLVLPIKQAETIGNPIIVFYSESKRVEK
jgi:hypothetical protein